MHLYGLDNMRWDFFSAFTFISLHRARARTWVAQSNIKQNFWSLSFTMMSKKASISSWATIFKDLRLVQVTASLRRFESEIWIFQFKQFVASVHLPGQNQCRYCRVKFVLGTSGSWSQARCGCRRTNWGNKKIICRSARPSPIWIQSRWVWVLMEAKLRLPWCDDGGDKNLFSSLFQSFSSD